MTANIYDLSDTWNNAGTTFTGIGIDVTNTASHADSRVVNHKVDGSPIHQVTPAGAVLATNGSAAAPAFSHIGGESHGWYKDANSYVLSTGGTAYVRFNYNRFSEYLLTSTGAVCWSSTASTTGSVDVGLERGDAGLAEVTSGTTGDLRDLGVRSLVTDPLTVATLPAATARGAGARAFVTDATTPAFGVTVTGGGAVATPVYSDGSSWIVG